METSDNARLRTGTLLFAAGALCAGLVLLLFFGLRDPESRSPTFFVTAGVVALQPLLLFGNSALHARSGRRLDFPSTFLTHSVVLGYCLVTLGTVALFNLVLFRAGATPRAYVTLLVAEAMGAGVLWLLTRAFLRLRQTPPGAGST
jgi:hypothetical protein